MGIFKLKALGVRKVFKGVKLIHQNVSSNPALRMGKAGSRAMRNNSSPPNCSLITNAVFRRQILPVRSLYTTPTANNKDINMDGNSAVKFISSLYNDPFRWQVVKGVSFFVVGVYVARELAYADLHPEVST